MFNYTSPSHMALDRLLSVLDVGVVHFTICDIRDGWGARFDACKTATLHYCVDGMGSLIVHNTLPIPLERNTFVLLPPNLPYRIESGAQKQIQLEHRARICGSTANESIPMLTVGDGQEGIITSCGEIRVGLTGGPDLFTSLGEPFVVRFDAKNGLHDQFVMLMAESARPSMGSRVLSEALLKQCLVLSLRRRMEDGASPLPWLTGVTDPRLSRALHAIIEQPAVEYTVDNLARIAGMSRSAFAASFRRSFGQSPMNLVKLFRLRRASDLLVTTALPVTEVAKRVGFSSRSNFSLSFSEVYGLDPSAFRRKHTIAPS